MYIAWNDIQPWQPLFVYLILSNNERPLRAEAFCWLWTLIAVRETVFKSCKLTAFSSCSSLNIRNARLSTDSVANQTAVNVTCDDGYVLDTGDISVVVVCQADATWFPATVNCTGTCDNALLTIYIRLYSNNSRYWIKLCCRYSNVISSFSLGPMLIEATVWMQYTCAWCIPIFSCSHITERLFIVFYWLYRAMKFFKWRF